MFLIQAVLRDVLDKFLPDDLHIRCNGRIRGKFYNVHELSCIFWSLFSRSNLVLPF
jgi:hypothetical protein